MTKFGPWQDGPIHTLRVNHTPPPPGRDDWTFSWDNPTDPHPTPDFLIAGGGQSYSSRAQLLQTPGQADVALDPAAHDCLWQHVARDNGFDGAFWRPDLGSICPTIGADNPSIPEGLLVGANYAWDADFFAGNTNDIAWTNYHAVGSLDGMQNAAPQMAMASEIQPPWSEIPDNAWVSYDLDDTVKLLSGTFEGYTGGALSPMAWLRVWGAGDPVAGWWPGFYDVGGTYGQGLVQDPGTVDNWVGSGRALGPFGPDDTISEPLPTDWLTYLAPELYNPATSKFARLDIAWQSSNMHSLTLPSMAGAHTSQAMVDFITRPKFTLVYQTARYRFGYETSTQPPLRQFPRTDGLATSSARRVWPPARSAQGSNRRVGGYL